MQLVVVSGRSGSGKSTALHVLEDIGFTCIDNLPASLLPALTEHNQSLDNPRYAVSIDARNHPDDLTLLPEILLSEPLTNINKQIIFLDASEEVLVTRFSETRRKHPLSNNRIGLKEAIAKEQQLLQPILDLADISIDTTNMKFHDLRGMIKRRFTVNNSNEMAVLFQSFGFKYGIPQDADLVFDVRCLPNPHWQNNLRKLTGQDQAVIDFLQAQKAVQNMCEDLQSFIHTWLPHYQNNNRSYLTITIGCTGGQHRSVYIAEKLASYFAKTHTNIQCRHRELAHAK